MTQCNSPLCDQPATLNCREWFGWVWLVCDDHCCNRCDQARRPIDWEDALL